ncbi:hypothetical protein BHM03_00033501 [Ensete ventricosum]|nr:hypothetical protein BHM03_00033501 [Ensete ventricosum]
MTTFGHSPSSVTFQRLLLLLEGHRQRKSTIRSFYSFCRIDTLFFFAGLSNGKGQKRPPFSPSAEIGSNGSLEFQSRVGIPTTELDAETSPPSRASLFLCHLFLLSSYLFFLPYSWNLACSLDSSPSIDRLPPPPPPPPLREIRLMATGKKCPSRSASTLDYFGWEQGRQSPVNSRLITSLPFGGKVSSSKRDRWRDQNRLIIPLVRRPLAIRWPADPAVGIRQRRLGPVRGTERESSNPVVVTAPGSQRAAVDPVEAAKPSMTVHKKLGKITVSAIGTNLGAITATVHKKSKSWGPELLRFFGTNSSPPFPRPVLLPAFAVAFIRGSQHGRKVRPRGETTVLALGIFRAKIQRRERGQRKGRNCSK